MKISFGLHLEQSQKLIMTPALRQAIEILQLSSLELGDLIKQELEKNPVIELKDENKNEDNQVKEEIDWEEYFEHNESYYRGSQQEVGDEEYNPESFVKDTISLKEHLLFQLHVSTKEPQYKAIGEYIIECIDH